jgi:hypothetical protein
MITKIARLSLLAISTIGVGVPSAFADWDRPPGYGYGAPPPAHRNFEPRYHEGFARPWWRADHDRWDWRRRHARWDDRGPPPQPPRRDWRYD